MIDYGIKAAMLTAFRFFTDASRATGRTDEMLKAARPGDYILCASEPEYRRTRRLLKEMDKLAEFGGRNNGVSVGWGDPKKAPMRARGTNPDGATIFSHDYIEGYWHHRLDQIDRDLRFFQEQMSTQAPPPSKVHEMVEKMAYMARMG